MTESDTQKAIIQLIQLKGGVVTRINSGSMIVKSQADRVYRVQLADKGTSDLIACYKGIYLAIEVKYGSNKPTPDQIEFLQSVAESGGVGVVAYDIETVEAVLDFTGFTNFGISCIAKIKEPNKLFIRESR